MYSNFRQIYVFLTLQAIFTSCRATAPKAAPKEVIEDLESDRTSPNVLKQQVLERVIIEPKWSDVVNGSNLLNLEMKSSSEVWCESNCSEFSILEVAKTDSLSLGAVKRPIRGNTTPGVLDVRREFSRVTVVGKRIEILNVGRPGETVVLEPDYFNEERPNFYALPMELSVTGAADSSLVLGKFDEKEVEIDLGNLVIGSDLNGESKPKTAFVMGSLMEPSLHKTSGRRIFRATKIIYPWTGS